MMHLIFGAAETNEKREFKFLTLTELDIHV